MQILSVIQAFSGFQHHFCNLDMFNYVDAIWRVRFCQISREKTIDWCKRDGTIGNVKTVKMTNIAIELFLLVE